MKKSILILLTFFVIKASYSQTEKGKMFIGGQINVSGNSQNRLDTLYKNNYKSKGITLSPTFGYFIKDNIAIGANITFRYLNSKQTNKYTNITPTSRSDKSTSIGYGIGGFVRYYSNINDKFKFFLQGDLSYLKTEQKVTQSNYPIDQDYTNNSISCLISPGLVYFVTPNFGIQTTFGNLNYSFNIQKDKTKSYDNHYITNNYGLNLNISTITLGFNYYF